MTDLEARDAMDAPGGFGPITLQCPLCQREFQVMGTPMGNSAQYVMPIIVFDGPEHGCGPNRVLTGWRITRRPRGPRYFIMLREFVPEVYHV